MSEVKISEKKELEFVQSQVTQDKILEQSPVENPFGPEDSGEYNFFTYFVASTASVAGVLFGYDNIFNAINTLDDFRTEFGWDVVVAGKTDPSLDTISWYGSSFYLAAAFTALFAGTSADLFGRKPSFIGFVVAFIIGSTLQTFAVNTWMLLLGRIVAGLGVGGLSTITPMYSSEVAPAKIRGTLVGLFQLSITIGIVGSGAAAYGLDGIKDGWRYALGIQSIIAVLLFFAAFFIPESPRFLIQKGKDDEAKHALERLRGDEHANNEYTHIKEMVNFEESLGHCSWKDIFTTDLAFIAYTGMVLQLLQQMCGMNTIIFYASNITNNFKLDPLLSQLIVNGINFATTVVALIMLVDKVGRRTLLIIGAIGMCLCYTVVGSLYDQIDIEEKAGGYSIFALLCLFVVFFAATWGPNGWIIPPEISPLRARGKICSLTTCTSWTGSFIIGKIVPHLEAVSGTFLFLFFAAWNVILIVWTLVSIPETRHKSIEHMERIFWVRKFRDIPAFWKERLNDTFGKSA
eukprot:Nk52_evm30s243 gene=Nk52_evmTU30s243